MARDNRRFEIIYEAGEAFSFDLDIGFVEEITEDNCYIPAEAEYEDWGEVSEEWDIALAKPGLWENIRKKKEREGKKYKPAKKNDKDRPDDDSFKQAQSKFILHADKSELENINRLVYTEENTSNDMEFSDLVSIKPEGILPDPPENTSDVTKSEIKQISELTQSLTATQKNLVMLSDEDPNLLFAELLDSSFLPLPIEKFNKAWNILEPVIIYLKNKFNRPRPEQLVSVFPRFYDDLSINVIKTKTHQTPAYPSGHTAYAALMASILSDMYPDQSSKFYEIANLAGHARVLQGVHYPSDNDAAMVITSAIWQDIKHNIEDDLKMKKMGYTPTKSSFKYEDPKTGQIYEYQRRGIYKKNGRTLVPARGSEYQGRKVRLGKPFLTPDGPKKRSVYVKNEKGNVVKVNFGDPNMKIKKSDPARRKSFRARHKCETPGPKWKARYWS